jgi:hypothetical protein
MDAGAKVEPEAHKWVATRLVRTQYLEGKGRQDRHAVGGGAAGSRRRVSTAIVPVLDKSAR